MAEGGVTQLWVTPSGLEIGGVVCASHSPPAILFCICLIDALAVAHGLPEALKPHQSWSCPVLFSFQGRGKCLDPFNKQQSRALFLGSGSLPHDPWLLFLCGGIRAASSLLRWSVQRAAWDSTPMVGNFYH